MPTAQVPQFIDLESKIIGPLSLRQFLFIAGGGGIIFGLSFVLRFGLWILVSLFIAALSLALAFVKINQQPLHKIIISALKFYWSPRLYTWKRSKKTRQLIQPTKPPIEQPKLRQRLSVEELEKITQELEEQEKK